MSIDISEFRKIRPTKRRGRNNVRVEAFLRENKDKAFTPTEIKEGMENISLHAIEGVLHHLKKENIVLCHSPYYAYNQELEEAGK